MRKKSEIIWNAWKDAFQWKWGFVKIKKVWNQIKIWSLTSLLLSKKIKTLAGILRRLINFSHLFILSRQCSNERGMIRLTLGTSYTRGKTRVFSLEVARQLPLNSAKNLNRKTHLRSAIFKNPASFLLVFANVSAHSPLAGFIWVFGHVVRDLPQGSTLTFFLGGPIGPLKSLIINF